MLAALALLSDSRFYVSTLPGSAAEPVRIQIMSEGEAVDHDQAVRVLTTHVLVNGRRTNMHLTPEKVRIAAGKRGTQVTLRPSPSIENVWLQGDFKIVDEKGRTSPAGLYHFLPPTGRRAEIELALVRARYLGKQVWVYGGDVHEVGAERECFVGLRSMRVADVRREADPRKIYSSVITLRFAPARLETMVRDEQRHAFGDKPSAESRTTSVSAPTSLLLGEKVSLTPPSDAWKRKAQMIEQAMRMFDVTLPRTKREALWILGQPSDGKPWRTIFAENTWVYSIGAPFSHVLEFRHGKVAKRSLDGQLP